MGAQPPARGSTPAPRPDQPFNGYSLAISLLLATSLSGCGTLSTAIEDMVRTARGNTKNQPARTTPVGDAPTNPGDNQDATKVLVSPDGKLQVTVPVDWNEDRDLNEKADLQVSNRSQELYLIVLSESKADFQNMTLAKHSALTREILLKSLASPQVSDPAQLTIGGNPAVQYQIQGAIDNLNVTYLHTTVETDTSYHQIIAWTLRSRFAQNGPKLQAVIQNLKETEGQ